MCPLDLKVSVSEALTHLKGLVEFAYQMGFHEMGYDPVAVVEEALGSRAVDPDSPAIDSGTPSNHRCHSAESSPCVIVSQSADSVGLEDLPDVPKKSRWRHKDGAIYTVLGHVNVHSTQPDRYPPSVVYAGADHRTWCRRVVDWKGSMTRLEET